MEENERQFKGVWIDKSIWLDEKLNILDKVLLVEIDSLDNEASGCFASNKYLAEFCQCSETKVSNAISKLTKLGYIYVKSFNGRTRVLKSLLHKNCEGSYKICEGSYKNCKADLQNLQDNNIDNNTINNKINNIDNNINTVVLGVEDKEVFDFWNSKKIIQHKSLTDNIIKAIQNCRKTKKLTTEDIKVAIDRYATMLNDTSYKLCSYKWGLVEFLKQGNAITDFLDDGSKWLNYQRSKSNSTGNVLARLMREIEDAENN